MRENRFSAVIQHLKEVGKIYNDADFSAKVGKGRSYVSEVKSGKRPLTEHFVLSMEEVYPEINGAWLLTGEGEMLKSTPKRPAFESNATLSDNNYVEVEFVDLRASAGMQSGFSVDQHSDRVTRLVCIEDDDPSKYIVVRVNGISMDDGTARSISEGAELLAKRVERLEDMRIRTRLYCIFSQSGDVIKQVSEVNAKEGYLKCHSFNPAYEDFTIPIEEIFHIFEIKSEINRPIML